MIDKDDRGNKIVRLVNLESVMDSDPDEVIKNSLGRLDTVMIVGYDKDGEYFFASSSADGGICMWLLEQAKRSLFDAAETE